MISTQSFFGQVFSGKRSNRASILNGFSAPLTRRFQRFCFVRVSYPFVVKNNELFCVLTKATDRSVPLHLAKGCLHIVNCTYEIALLVGFRLTGMFRFYTFTYGGFWSKVVDFPA